MNKRITAVLCALALTACAQAPAPAPEQTTAAQTAEQTEALTEAQIEAQTEQTTVADTEQTEAVPEQTETSAEAEKTLQYTAPELSSLRWDTDYVSLSNAKAFRISDGDVVIDLDGDGKNETINFTHENDDEEAKGYTDYEYSGLLPVIPYINGEPADVKTLMNDEYGYAIFDKYSFSMPSGYFYICDIDANDGYKEIAFAPYSYTDDYYTVFVRYDGGQLVYAGNVSYDTPDAEHEDYERSYGIGDMNITWGRPLITDGSGIVTGATRLTYQTWFGYTQYAFNDDGILDELAAKEVYPYGYENKDSYDAVWAKVKANWGQASEADDCMLTKDITVYKTPSEDSEAIVMTAQPAIPTGECRLAKGRFFDPVDYENWSEEYKNLWVYVAAKDGTCGWMHAYPYEDTADIFTVMTMYD